MYVHKGKRKFSVTIREIRDDGTMGESETFSTYESQTKYKRHEFVNYLIDKINETNKEMIK